jgi:hypothetical protein
MYMIVQSYPWSYILFVRQWADVASCAFCLSDRELMLLLLLCSACCSVYCRSERPSHSCVLWCDPTTSDYRSSNVAPSDSDRDCPSSRRDSETSHGLHQQSSLSGLRLGVTAPSNDSESGGSHSPSPRASRRRQVSHYSLKQFTGVATLGPGVY